MGLMWVSQEVQVFI